MNVYELHSLKYTYWHFELRGRQRNGSGSQLLNQQHWRGLRLTLAAPGLSRAGLTKKQKVLDPTHVAVHEVCL